MKKYEKPSVEITMFESKSIIQISGLTELTPAGGAGVQKTFKSIDF